MTTVAIRRKPPIANAVLGTFFFVLVEAMFFAAFISSYLVIRAGAGLNWVPPSNVRLPVEATAINTAALLISGFLMIFSMKCFANKNPKAKWLFLGALVLGISFVVFQGREWIGLINLGMTILSGVFAACFFLLIGMHGLHAVTAIVAMIYLWFTMQDDLIKIERFQAVTIYWLFIVGIWPVLYALVYF